MLLYENKKIKLLNYIKTGLNPFKNFVSTGEIEERLGVVQSRKDIIASVKTSGCSSQGKWPACSIKTSFEFG